MSDRLYRAAQAFHLDDYNDDEITVSGTGQILSRQNVNYISPSSSKLVFQQSSNPSTNPVLLYCYLAAALVAGAILYHVSMCYWMDSSLLTSRLIKKKKVTPSQIKSKTSSSSTNYQDAMITKLKSDDMPHLVPDDSEPAQSNASTQPSLTIDCNSTDLLEARTPIRLSPIKLTPPRQMVLPAPIKTSLDDARQTVRLASLFEQACAEQGRTCDMSAALQWAATQQKTEKVINARLGEEIRRYTYDNAQRHVDRSLTQNHHQEKLAAQKSDKQWLTKLSGVKGKSSTVLGRSMFYSFVGGLFVNVVCPIVFAFQIWRTLSLSQVLCYGTGTVYDPIRESLEQLDTAAVSWYGRYISYSSVDIWTSLVMEEQATCAMFVVGRVLYAFVALTAIIVGTWILRLLAISERFLQLITSAYLLFILSINGWIPDIHLYRLVSSICALGFCTHCMLWRQYNLFRQKFYAMETPPVTAVNESIEWFDDAICIIQLAPFIGCLLWMLSLYMPTVPGMGTSG